MDLSGWNFGFNATFNNISVISLRSVLLVEESGVLGENHRPVESHWRTLSHNVVSSTSRLSWVRTHNVSGDRHCPVGRIVHRITETMSCYYTLWFSRLVIPVITTANRYFMFYESFHITVILIIVLRSSDVTFLRREIDLRFYFAFCFCYFVWLCLGFFFLYIYL